jgi:hypothetical protein
MPVGPMADKRLDFGLLGPLEMSFDGVLVPLGTPKQRAVLAVLLMNRNNPVGVGQRIVTAAGLQNGDRIRICDHEFTFQLAADGQHEA